MDCKFYQVLLPPPLPPSRRGGGHALLRAPQQRHDCTLNLMQQELQRRDFAGVADHVGIYRKKSRPDGTCLLLGSYMCCLSS